MGWPGYSGAARTESAKVPREGGLSHVGARGSQLSGGLSAAKNQRKKKKHVGARGSQLGGGLNHVGARGSQLGGGLLAAKNQKKTPTKP